jgi:hypothetical protein
LSGIHSSIASRKRPTGISHHSRSLRSAPPRNAAIAAGSIAASTTPGMNANTVGRIWRWLLTVAGRPSRIASEPRKIPAASPSTTRSRPRASSRPRSARVTSHATSGTLR